MQITAIAFQYQITAIAFQYQTIHLASYQSYKSQIIQYHPNRSIDEEGETLTGGHRTGPGGPNLK